MIRLVATATLAAALAFSASAKTYQTSAGKVEVTQVVSGLDNPWAVAFLPSGQFVITERDGPLLLVSANGAERQRISGAPAVYAQGQGGLLDVVLDPDFPRNKVLYLSYAEPAGSQARTAVLRAVLDEANAALTQQKVIFRQNPAARGGRHFGSRIVPDGKGNLWVTLGDRGVRKRAQDISRQWGKVVRIKATGGGANGNPYPADPELWSIGHRNAQGAAMDAQGRLWTVSHGAAGGDEINQPKAGRNYGWPVISFGRHYSGGKIGEGTAKSGMEQPVWYWDPSIAPSGMTIYSGKLWPEWKGDIFVGALKFDYVSRLDRNGTAISGEEQLFRDDFIRIRDVREAPDGSLWFLAVGDGGLFQVTPSR